MNKIRNIIFYFSFFFVLLFLFDQIVGITCNYFMNRLKDGRFYKIKYSLDESKEDIIIIGSSRAETNYNPAIFTEILKLSCWNAGRGNQGPFFWRTILQSTLERYSPGIILVNIDDQVLEDEFSTDAAMILKPFFISHKNIFKQFCYYHPSERYKCMSNIYIYNSILYYFFRPFFLKNKDGKPSEMGWKPRRGQKTMTPMEVESLISKHIPMPDSGTHNLDYNQIQIFKEMIEMVKKKKANLVFVVSPSLLPVRRITPTIIQIDQFAKYYNFPLYNFSNDTSFVGHSELFYDSDHMNENGANKFSTKLADKINELLKHS